jgi:hypothetical protein
MAKTKAEPKSKRLALVQANIQLGVDLIALRNISASKRDFGRIVRTRYEIDQPHALACMQVARLYADRGDEIVTRLDWPTLVALASASVPARRVFEITIMAGEHIGAAEIRRARGRPRLKRPSKN